MIALYQAIVAAFDASSLPFSITGGLYQDEAPAAQVISRPYCILNDVKGAEVDRSFSGKLLEPYAIQFSVHASPKMTSVSLAESLTAVFDNANLTLSAGILILFIRRYPIISYIDPTERDENSNKVWRTVCVYDATVQNP